MNSTPRTGQRSFDSLTLFTFLWAVAVLIHQVSRRELSDWHDLVLLAVASATLLHPSSIARLAALAVAHIGEVAIELPQVSNHWLLTGIANLTILTVLATRPGRRPDGRLDRAALYRALAAPLRLVLIGAYSFAFLAKLNRAFLDPDLSCASVMYARLAERTSLPLGTWTRLPAIWFTVIVEGLIPLLLTLSRTRLAGVFIAFVFHIFMGLAGYYDFSSAASALLALFLPADMPQRLTMFAARFPRLRGAAASCRTVLQRPLALPVVLAAGYLVLSQIPRLEPLFVFTMRVWFALAASALVVAGLALRGLPSLAVQAAHLRVAHPVYLVGPLLVLLNGLSPYIGLKTEHSFTMFSNLMTEGESGNHLFMPRGLRVFPLQDRIVRIVESSSPRLSDYVARRRRLVFYSLHRLVQSDPSMSVVYEHAGQRYHVPRVSDDPVLGRAINPLAGKLLHFRFVRPICAH